MAEAIEAPRFSSDLSGRVALVTGTTSGLGKRFAHVLAQSGAKVVLTGRRVERLEEVKAQIESLGGTALALPLDMTDADNIKKVVADVESATHMHFSSDRRPPFCPGENRGATGTNVANVKEVHTNATGKEKMPRSTDRKVCIFHDPAKGKECRSGAQCGYQHVDPRDKGNRKRHEEAVKEMGRSRRQN